MLPVIIDRSVGVSWIQATESEGGDKLVKEEIYFVHDRERVFIKNFCRRTVDPHHRITYTQRYRKDGLTCLVKQ